jgi:hypothetical protein
MYKDVEICAFVEEWSIKLRPSRLEQVLLPSVFHTEECDILRLGKVNATMADHLISRGQTHSRKMQDYHLVQLGGEVPPKCVVFLAT